MTEWGALRDAYGTAGDIPGLLNAAEVSGNEYGPEWNKLRGRLCHQGTVYTASYAALPLLAQIAQEHAPAGYIASMDLASAIVAAKDGPTDSLVVRHEHAEAIARLRDLAESNLALADGDVEFVYGLQALMAFEDGGVWQRQLTHVADRELPFDCPSCRELLLLDLEGPESSLVNDSDGSVAPTSVLSADPAGGSVGARMLALCRAAGRAKVASQLRYALLSATCPSCAAEFDVPDALA